MAELINGCAEAIVKENDRASKEAANRLGTRLLFNVLGHHVRQGIAGSVARAVNSARPNGGGACPTCWPMRTSRSAAT